MSSAKVVLSSLSAAMDGGFIAIADVSEAMSAAGAEGDYRLIVGASAAATARECRGSVPIAAVTQMRPPAVASSTAKSLPFRQCDPPWGVPHTST